MSEQLLLQKIDSVFKALDERLDSTVVQIKQLKDSNQLFHERIERLENKSSDKEELHSASGARGATAKTVDDYTTLGPEEPTLATEDIQSEFAAVKDTLTKVKLPADLRLCDSRQGIRRSDQTTYNILARCGRYAETSIKLLSSINEGNIDEDSVQQLFTIQLAQIRYLQEEYSALVVQSQFDDSTARIFRSLQKNTSGLTPEALQQLKTATALAAVKPQQNSPTRPTRVPSRNFSPFSKSDNFRPFVSRRIPSSRPSNFVSNSGFNAPPSSGL